MKLGTFRQWVPLSSVLLVAVSVFFTMVLAEGVLRLFPGLFSVELQQIIQASPDKPGIAHPYIGHLHKPNNTLTIAGRDFRNVHHTDGYGFHNAWPWPDHAEIVAVGDSLTFGYGVTDDEAWPALVAKALPHDRLVNLGLIGAGPQQYLRVYETFGVRLRPKLMLVGLFIGNDVWDDYMFDRWLKSGIGGNYLVWRDFGRPQKASLVLQQPVGGFIFTVLWNGHLLASHSYLYNWLHFVRRSLKKYGFSEGKTFQAPDGTRIELSLEGFAAKAEEAQPDHQSFAMVIQSLQQLHSKARGKGTETLIILQPSKEEVYLPLMGETTFDADLGKPLRAKLGELGISYLDLLPGFRSRAAEGEVLFFETDGHPNARGYALTAELVTSYLKDNAKRFGLKADVLSQANVSDVLPMIWHGTTLWNHAIDVAE